MKLKDFWYVVAESDELSAQKPLARELFGEWVVLFRDESGHPRALRDKCRHRAGRLSKGVVKDGCLRCPYHGWAYDGEGLVTGIPSEGGSFEVLNNRRGTAYDAEEVDGYVYVRLVDPRDSEREVPPVPRMPHYSEKGWHQIRLLNHFDSTVEDCAENFIDIPHTVSVHPSVFRIPRGERLEANLRRENGSVVVEYAGESDNLGWFRRFLNPGGNEIVHRDTFFMPNHTRVDYELGPRRKFIITSQSVPTREGKVAVYTDLTYDYGIWSHLAAPIIRWQAQLIIDQDIEVLRDQKEVIEKFGRKFMDSPADRVHAAVRSIRRELEHERDPRALPLREEKVAFWV